MNNVNKLFEAKGWRLAALGGGCEGYDLVMRDTARFIATNEAGINIPDNLNNIMLGHYSKTGAEINKPYIMTFNQICELIESYNQLLDGQAKGFTYGK